MRIQHNIAALNSYRQLGNNNNAVSKNLEKLSSGYRINRAGDDASGLAVSEKMRAQITGLETAQKNAQDGISLVQTAEGNLTEVHSMLNRMVELATQSANGTYQDSVDRENIQKEVDSLKSEINRIADSANYNGIKLLDGSLSGGSTSGVLDPKAVQIVAPTTSGAGITIDGITAAKSGNYVFGDAKLDNATGKFGAMSITFKNASGESKTLTFSEQVANDIFKGKTTAKTALADLLNGKDTSGALTLVDGTAEDLKEFQSLFEVSSSATDHNLVISLKNPQSKATIDDVKFASGASSGAAITALASISKETTAADGIEFADKGGFSISFGAVAAVGDTVTAGGKTFEFCANQADIDAAKLKGNIGVLNGADDEASAANLANAMNANGMKAHVDANDATKVLIDKSSLEEQQQGSQITASGGVNITKTGQGNSSTTVTMGTAPSNGKNTFTLNYIDANGKAQKKDVEYEIDPAHNTVNDFANALKDAISGDSELSSMFKVSTNLGAVTIEAKDKGAAGAVFTGVSSTDSGKNITSSVTSGHSAGKDVDFTSELKAGDTITVDGKTYQFVAKDGDKVTEGNVAITMGKTTSEAVDNLARQLTKNGVKFDHVDGSTKLHFADTAGKKGGLILQVGDTSDSYQQVTVSVGSMSAASLGIEGINVINQEGAKAAIDKIKSAINTVSSTRGDLGAIQNRLDHTINNLGVTSENMTAAESRIRDVDMAKEMMDFTKNNILSQAAQAMLAQANQIPQGVLQLLQ